MKIYLSGPITGTHDYMDRFSRAEKVLREAGHTVVNPAKINAQLPDNSEYKDYMQISLCLLDLCDTIFMMEGWQQSNGCQTEMEFAIKAKHTIVFEGGRDSEKTFEPRSSM